MSRFVAHLSRLYTKQLVVMQGWGVGEGEDLMKVYLNGPGHMTKLAVMPMYKLRLKPLKIFSRTESPETWHVASCTQALQRFMFLKTK